MKIPDPTLPQNPESAYDRLLGFSVLNSLRQIINKVNAFGDGRSSAIDNQATAAPTTGTWALGDFVKNSAPSELGTAGSRYILTGWLCITGGTPGTWREARVLTGN